MLRARFASRAQPHPPFSVRPAASKAEFHQCPFAMAPWNQKRQTGQEGSQFGLPPCPGLAEHDLRISPDRTDLDAAIGGDLGQWPAADNPDRNARLGRREPE